MTIKGCGPGNEEIRDVGSLFCRLLDKPGGWIYVTV